ncbi:MAG: hypothetical protein AB1758_27615, partial [Candidatus Eremiobacterota bacterium]
MRQRASALAVVIAVMFLLFTFMMAVGSSTVVHLNHIISVGGDVKARYAGMSGLQAAVSALSMDQTLQGQYAPCTMPNDGGSSFQVTFYNNVDGNLDPTSVPDGTKVPKGKVYIVSVGESGRGRSRTLSSVSGLAEPNLVSLNFAAFGDQRVALGDNALVDSYDSNNNPDPSKPDYEPYLDTSDDKTWRKGASLASNETMNAVMISDSAKLDGDVIVGPRSDIDDALVEDPSIFRSGGTSIAGQKVSLPICQVPAGLTVASTPDQSVSSGNSVTLDPGQYDSLSGSGDPNQPDKTTINLNPGTYHFTGNVQLDSCTLVSTGGTVTVYIQGDLSLTGAARVNPGGKARDMRMYFVPSSEETTTSTLDPTTGEVVPTSATVEVPNRARLADDSQATMVLVGHDLTTSLGEKAELFGGALGSSVSMSMDSKIHYDAGLK